MGPTVTWTWYLSDCCDDWSSVDGAQLTTYESVVISLSVSPTGTEGGVVSSLSVVEYGADISLSVLFGIGSTAVTTNVYSVDFCRPATEAVVWSPCTSTG